MATYSISLDDVDVALLPLQTYKYNDFLKKEHYEFQVMKTDIVREEPELVLYTCHTCATRVPAAFAREHAASVKHRANVRIASEAASRTRKLIAADPPPHTAPLNKRFCANCSALVGKNHEKTKEHKVAVMHDKLLWELMTAYIGDDDGNSYEDSEFSDDGTDDLSVQEEKGENSQAYNGFGLRGPKRNNSAAEKQRDSTLVTNLVEVYKKEICNKEDVDENENKHDKGYNGFGIYDSNAIDIEKGKQMTSDSTYIESNKKKEIDKTENQKHENSEDNNKLDDKTRMSDVKQVATKKNEQDGKDDDKSETNDVEIATSKLKEQENKIDYLEFVIKDNKQVKVFSDYYHSFTRKNDTITCKVCSSTFDANNADAHMFSLKHLNKMPSTLIDEHCVRKINDVYSHCILCNQMIKNTNVAKHYLTIGHNQREKQAVTENTNQASTSKMNTANSANIGAPQLVNSATAKTDNTNGNSKAAQVKIPEKKSQNQAKAIDWPVIYPYEVTSQENTVRCVICDCQVPNNPDNRKTHLVGQNHANNVKNKRPLYPYENTKQAGVARCVICNIKVFITPENLKEHLTGLSHAKNVILREKEPKAKRAPWGKPVAAPAPPKKSPKVVEPRKFETPSDTIPVRKPGNFYFSWI